MRRPERPLRGATASAFFNGAACTVLASTSTIHITGPRSFRAPAFRAPARHAAGVPAKHAGCRLACAGANMRHGPSRPTTPMSILAGWASRHAPFWGRNSTCARLRPPEAQPNSAHVLRHRGRRTTIFWGQCVTRSYLVCLLSCKTGPSRRLPGARAHGLARAHGMRPAGSLRGSCRELHVASMQPRAPALRDPLLPKQPGGGLLCPHSWATGLAACMCLCWGAFLAAICGPGRPHQARPPRPQSLGAGIRGVLCRGKMPTSRFQHSGRCKAGGASF